MSYDDTHSFLFGLNQFSTPTSNSSPQASGSNSVQTGAANADGNEQQRQSSALLNGLGAFGGNENDVLEGGSFADQLELWTNANFSFDGPTGHALLGDEDKEKDEADKKDKDKEEEDKRAGKRARSEGLGGGGRGKAPQRNEEDGFSRESVPKEPTHQTHKDQAALQQQQHYFAPPSRNAEEARRPGFDQPMPAAPADRSRSSSQQESRPNQPNAAAVANGYAGPTSSFGQQPSGFPGMGMGAGAAFSGQQAFGGNQAQQPPQSPFQAPQQNGGQLDLTSLLAIQQLVAQNPLALASLSSFAGLNPQLGALGAQLNNLGALNGTNLQQFQQQYQHQQAQQHQQHQQQPQPQPQPQQQQHQPQQHHQQQQANGSAPPYPAQMTPSYNAALQQQMLNPLAVGYQNGWPVFNTFGNVPQGGSMAAQVPAPSAPFSHRTPAPTTFSGATASGAPDDDEGDKRRNKDKKKRQPSSDDGDGPSDKPRPSMRDRKLSSSDEHSSGETSKMTAADRAAALEERAAERDPIPPLKLIDTGNPEADAEANRLAIEEDKRRRNTAASARFRVKKKQREAALEAHTKELSSQLAELKEEITKLRNENQWLKGLIQVRPGGKEGIISPPRNIVNSAVNGSETFQAAQQLQALQQAVSIQQQQKQSFSEASSHTDRQRDTGIRPRGVGTVTTESGMLHKRDREE